MTSLKKQGKRPSLIRVEETASDLGYESARDFIFDYYVTKSKPLWQLAYVTQLSETTIARLLRSFGIARRASSNNKKVWKRSFGAIFERPNFNEE